MSEREEIDPAEPQLQGAERELELALGRLVPARPELSPATVWAEAIARAERARRSAKMQAWLWRGIAAGLAVPLGLGLLKNKGTPTHESKTPQIVHPQQIVVAALQPPANVTRQDAAFDDRLLQGDRVMTAGMTSVPDFSSNDSARNPEKGDSRLFELERSQERGL